MVDFRLLPPGFEVTVEELQQTPPRVLRLLIYLLERLQALEAENAALKKRVAALEVRLNQNSSNSSQPPSADSPFTKKAPQDKSAPGRAGAKKGHKGHRQELLAPTVTQSLHPVACACGNTCFPETQPYYTHQVIELPEIAVEVTHFVLHRGKCPGCGKINKTLLPPEHRTGYGPRLSALIAEMAGNQGDSRSLIQNFCQSVLGITISLGAIQKVIDRVSAAIEPHYEAIGQEARSAPVNHIDETTYRRRAKLTWLWVMANCLVVFFMLHGRRTAAAFADLIGDWSGILISDGYKVYQKYVGQRQTCLAHLIRDAKALAERPDKETARFGGWAQRELQRLCHMAHAPPNQGEWQAFYARFIHLITRNLDYEDDRGKFARRLLRELECMWVFLDEEGVTPTNNHAERVLRFAVLWRKRSLGTQSEKGDRWVERILSLRQTCRVRGRQTFPVLVEAMTCYFKGQPPNIAWISQA
ncbi:MAG: IS66 family transposase [Proteobacteria bacterium]|nr:IS66 family transposase [Pseudomonadota bacterium]